MPVHDWTRVDAGVFHDFHSSWIIHLKEKLNAGLLPQGFYALAEQHAGRTIADVLTLHVGDELPEFTGGAGVVAVAEAPPRAGRKVKAGPKAALRGSRRTLTIRHVSNHRIVALVEILSPANKDRQESVNDFVDKVHAALQKGCHLLVVDLFPPTAFDPEGIHNAIWEDFYPEEEDQVHLGDKPLTLAAYKAGRVPHDSQADVVALAVGDALPDMPLYLDRDWYINTPLEKTYLAAYRGVPEFYRRKLE